MAKRDELIVLQSERVGVLQDENQQLSEALVALRSENIKADSRALTYGALGLAVGIIGALALSK